MVEVERLALRQRAVAEVDVVRVELDQREVARCRRARPGARPPWSCRTTSRRRRRSGTAGPARCSTGRRRYRAARATADASARLRCPTPTAPRDRCPSTGRRAQRMTDAPEGPAEGEPERGARRSPRGRRRRVAGRVHAQHRAGGGRGDRRVPDPARDHRRRRRRRRASRSTPTLDGPPTTPLGSTVADDRRPDDADRADDAGADRSQAPRSSSPTPAASAGSAAAMTHGAGRRRLHDGRAGQQLGRRRLTTSVVYYAAGDAAAQARRHCRWPRHSAG